MCIKNKEYRRRKDTWENENDSNKFPMTETYGVESKLMLLACVDDADL